MKNIFILFALAFTLFSNAQITQYSTNTSGTITCVNTKQDLVVVHEAGVTLSLTLAFPANPSDGQKVTFTSVGGVTSLNITAAIGTIINALTGMAAGSPATYMYYSATDKWYKLR